LESLSDDPWVLFPRRFRSRYLELVHEACGAAGFTPRVVQEAGKMNTLAALVDAGLGVTLLPSMVANWPRARVAVRPLAGKAPILPLDVIWRAHQLSPTAAQFVKLAVELREARERGTG
ncbi:MAG: LysR family substrate-binding domain-containing protein, partial [Gemmatimonadota bacterium]